MHAHSPSPPFAVCGCAHECDTAIRYINSKRNLWSKVFTTNTTNITNITNITIITVITIVTIITITTTPITSTYTLTPSHTHPHPRTLTRDRISSTSKTSKGEA